MIIRLRVAFDSGFRQSAKNVLVNAAGGCSPDRNLSRGRAAMVARAEGRGGRGGQFWIAVNSVKV